MNLYTGNTKGIYIYNSAPNRFTVFIDMQGLRLSRAFYDFATALDFCKDYE